jgi:hypothetical protein
MGRGLGTESTFLGMGLGKRVRYRISLHPRKNRSGFGEGDQLVHSLSVTLHVKHDRCTQGEHLQYFPALDHRVFKARLLCALTSVTDPGSRIRIWIQEGINDPQK